MRRRRRPANVVAVGEPDLLVYVGVGDVVDRVHQQIRFTYGNDVGGPTTTLTLSSSSHAFMTAIAPYVIYYGTTNGGGSLALHQSATEPERRRHRHVP